MLLRSISYVVGLAFAGILLICLVQRGVGLFQQPAGAARVRQISRGAQAAAPRQRRAFRQVRRGPAAARLPGLFGGLLGLPQPQAGRVPRLEGARLQRRRDQEDRVGLEDPDAVDQPRHRRAGDAQGAAVGQFPGRRSRTRSRRARPTTTRFRPTCRRSPRRAKAGRPMSIRCSPATRTSRRRCSSSSPTPRRRRTCTTIPISRTSTSRCRRRCTAVT